jgi:aspartyl-tRNA(Asn)/glutamyl-tRNA(Gln) amidotransferase subunit B
MSNRGLYPLAVQWVSQEPRITEHSPKEVVEALTQLKEGQLRSSLFKDALLSSAPGSLQDRIASQLAANGADIRDVVKKVLESNLQEVERYKHGESQLLGYFVGQVRKALEGKGDARAITEEIRRQLG